MAVLEVLLIEEKSGRRANAGKTVYDAQRTYHVEFDAPATASDAETADDGTTAIPSLYDAWAVSSSRKVIGIDSARLAEDQLIYVVTVSYSSDLGKSDGTQPPESPLDRPAEFSYDGDLQSEPYFVDVDGEPVINSAGEPFDTLPERLRPNGSFTLVRNVSTKNFPIRRAVLGRINAANKTLDGESYAARTLLCSKWSWQGPNVENGVTYWRETIEFLEREDGWDDEFEDRGYSARVDGLLQPILDYNGNPIQKPQPLDGSGGLKSIFDDAGATITRKPYETADFSAI